MAKTSDGTTFASIRRAIANNDIKPVYLLHGEEGYFIDALAKEFESILPDEDKTFNQYTLYAPETEPAKVIDLCRRLPMMSDRQVVILKEAQAIRSDQLNKLHIYASQPSPTTVLVICCRGAEFKGKELLKAVRENGVVFESKKFADYNIMPAIAEAVKSKGLSAEQKALEMLHEYIGNDLSKIYNEVDKLASILEKGAILTPEAIERNVGVSKDYNSFELVDAIAAKDAKKVFSITGYFRNNPKSTPLIMVTPAIFTYFSDLLIAYYCPDRTERGLMESMKLRYSFQAKRYLTGMRNYNPFQVIEVIGAIRDFDSKSKGIGSRQNEHDLFHDLIFHILTAPGKINV